MSDNHSHMIIFVKYLHHLTQENYVNNFIRR